MKIKNNKGYVAIDASIAILVLLIIIPTIAGLIYNVNKTNNYIDRKTEAISIAVNTIEEMKAIGITGINDSDYNEEEVVTKNENTYKIIIDVKDYANTGDGNDKAAIEGKVKIVTVTVKFKSGKQEKDVQLNTVIS